MNDTEKDRLHQINELFYHLAKVDDNSVNSLSLDRDLLKRWIASGAFRRISMYFNFIIFSIFRLIFLHNF